VGTEVIDGNGHVNNVAFVQWMQDAAVAHSDAVGCTQATAACGGIWVARSHTIEYRRQAFLGDVIEVKTWIRDCRMVSSRRKYEFVRASDGVVLARGETDWVLIDAVTHHPKEIPAELKVLYV
jgi:acyl-CoA thioester hydrolase